MEIFTVSSRGPYSKFPGEIPGPGPLIAALLFPLATSHSCALIPPALQANLKDGTSHNEWIILKIHSILNIT